jgi:hypothetical protein
MKKLFLFPVIFSLMSCSVGDTESAERLVEENIDATIETGCVISDAQIKELRDKFRAFAKQIPKFIKTKSDAKRPTLEHPFVEPLNVKLSILENPPGFEYHWIVKAEEGCKKNGSDFDRVDFEMIFRDGGQTITDDAHIHLKDNP